MNRQQVEWLEAIESVRSFMPELLQASIEVKELLWMPINDSFWSRFGEIVEGIDDLYRVLNWLSESLPEPLQSKHALWATAFGEASARLAKLFQQLNESMDAEDYLDASDLLHYEFIPFLQSLIMQIGVSEAQLQENFERNLHYISQRFPEVYADIKKEQAVSERYSIFYSSNGMANLSLNTEHGDTIRLYSKYDPQHEIDKWMERVSDQAKESKCALHYGFGLGYHAKSYAASYPQHSLYIYEPDMQLFLTALKVIRMDDLVRSANIAGLAVGNNREQKTRLIYRLLKNTGNEPNMLSIPFYDRLPHIDANQFMNDAKMAILNFTGSKLMYDRYGLEWTQNTLLNMGKTLTSPSISGLRNQFVGLTAVVIGAGPSLQEDIEELRKLSRRAVLIAAGSSIQSLSHYGIKPHLIVSIDGGEPNYDVFKNLDLSDVPLLFTPMIKYRILDRPFDQLCHVLLDSDFMTNRWLNTNGLDCIFKSTLSVTGTAIQAAIHLGCRTVVFTGQDLSYPGNRMYAEGAEHVSSANRQLIVERAAIEVENVRGQMNRTNNALKLTLDDIEELIGQYPEVRFVNTSKSGAKIAGTEWKPMSEIVIESQSQSIEVESHILKHAIQNLPKYEADRVEDVVKQMQQLPLEMKKLSALLEQMSMDIKQMEVWNPAELKRGNELIFSLNRAWGQFCESEAFTTIYLKVFRNPLIEFERELPRLLNEEETSKKIKLIQEIMKPVVLRMLEKTPFLLETAIEAMGRLEEDLRVRRDI